MIVEWFIAFIFGTFVDVLEMVLGDVVVIGTDVAGALEGVATMNAFFPITEMLAVAAMLLTVQGIMFLVKLTQTVVAHIPLVGGGGA